MNWHDVKKELPEKDGEYLVWGEGSLYYTMVVCDFRGDKDELKWSLEEDDGFRAIDVTHWMELPDPPKEEEPREELPPEQDNTAYIITIDDKGNVVAQDNNIKIE